jgi:hypothetical protein
MDSEIFEVQLSSVGPTTLLFIIMMIVLLIINRESYIKLCVCLCVCVTTTERESVLKVCRSCRRDECYF